MPRLSAAALATVVLLAAAHAGADALTDRLAAVLSKPGCRGARVSASSSSTPRPAPTCSRATPTRHSRRPRT
jgi:hypothetical protein